MSGEHRRFGGFLLPAIVVLVGAYFLLTGIQNSTLSAVTLKPVNWAGLALMPVGAVLAFSKAPMRKLAGVLVCGIGAILVICL